MADTAELREELRTLEGEIQTQQETVDQLRRDIGGDGVLDAPEQAQLLTSVEEQNALLETLQNRRETLRQRLQESSR